MKRRRCRVSVKSGEGNPLFSALCSDVFCLDSSSDVSHISAMDFSSFTFDSLQTHRPSFSHLLAAFPVTEDSVNNLSFLHFISS